MPYLTIEQIQAADDLPKRVVEMPEWGGSVLVRGLSKGGYDDIQAAAGDNPEKIEIAMLMACVAEPQLTEETARSLRYKSIPAYKRILDALTEVNSSGQEAVTAAKSLDAGEPGDDVSLPPGGPAEADGLRLEADAAD